MIYIKFILTNGEITVDEAQAKDILTSEAQLIPIRNEQGVWNGETINKAFIVRTIKDFEKMRWWKLEQVKIQNDIDEQERKNNLLKMSPEEKEKLQKEEADEKEKISKMFADLREKFKIGK